MRQQWTTRLGLALCVTGSLLGGPLRVHAQFAVQPLPSAPNKPAAAAPATTTKPADAAPAKAKPRPTPVGKEKTPATPVVRPLPAVKLGPTLSKAEVFGRAAPATVFLVAVQDNRWRTALGVIVSPQGVVISDSRLLSGVEKGQISAFLFDPSLAGDEDPLLFLRAHKDQALPAQIVRMDAETHLLMLQLPAAPGKKGHSYLDVVEVTGVNPGLDVLALRTRGAQTLAMASGTLETRRPDQIEVEPALGIESAGAPLVTMSGRLLGVCTFADKSVTASGVVRPTNVLRDLLAGKLGTTTVAPSTPAAPESPSEAKNAIEAVRIILGISLGQRMEKMAALRLHSDFIAAMARRGQRVVTGVDSVETLNATLKAMAKGSEAKAAVVRDLFPRLLTERSGSVFRKNGTQYELIKGSGHGLAALDDLTGGLYATDTHREILFYDETGPVKVWRPSGLAGVAALRASGGSLYVLLQDGRLIQANWNGTNSRQIFPRSLKAGTTLEASTGNLYVLSEGSVYRRRNNKWDQKIQPIAFSEKHLVARGEDWYGLDTAGRIFSSAAQQYIDRDGNILDIWNIGPDLLVLARDGNRYYYAVSNNTWGAWPRW